MRLARQAIVLLLWAATFGRGLFAQQLPTSPDKLQLRGAELRYVLPEPLFANDQSTEPIKAIYVNAWAFGSPKLAQLVRLADSTEINAFVVDIKDDTGCLLYPSEVKVAQEIGATKCVRTKDVRSRLDTLRAHDIYAIARIVVAKDPLLAERRPQWSVKNRVDGGLWRDRIGIAWVDAYNDSVWIYAAQLAEEAVKLGFNEVQFDYVRFPDEPKEALAEAIFAARKPGESERQGVQNGIGILAHRIQPLGVPVTFDIFGLTSSATGDLGIGQVWEDFVSVADVVLPMVYPSHYYRGSYGIAWPNGEPYRIVRDALSEAIERSRPLAKAAAIRPYLQAFTLGRRKPRYTPHEIREQIRAAEELGIDTWVLWNPRSVYQRDSLRPYRDGGTTASAGTQ
ncbi:MAG TPA: putative glycoside hydrolase [Gemmatimonadales bacterium]|nr:putative glycoside hydrolase [Gemmatimonadales bacterium]